MAEAQEEPPAAGSRPTDNPAVLPYRQWRVFWAHHEVRVSVGQHLLRLATFSGLP